MKKTLVLFISLLIINFSFIGNAKAYTFSDGFITLDDKFESVCTDFSKGVRIGGILILVAEFALPLIIIVRTSLDLYKVVASGKSEDFSKAGKKMISALIAAALVFFIPTIIDTIWGVVEISTGEKTENADSNVCKECIFDPFGVTCKNAVTTSEKKLTTSEQ